MGLIKYFKEKKLKKVKDEQAKQEKLAYEQRVKEVGEKNIPIDSISFLYCVDPSRSDDERSYSNGKLAFDYVIPVIKSGKKYFNIMTLEEVNVADAVSGKNPLTTERIAYGKMPKEVKCIGVEDVEMSILKHELSRDGYTFNISSKKGLSLESKIYNTGIYDGISDIIEIKTLRTINQDLNERLTKTYTKIRKDKEHKQKTSEARSLIDSLESVK